MLTIVAGGLQVHQNMARRVAEESAAKPAPQTAPSPLPIKEPTDAELEQFVDELSDEEREELGLDELNTVDEEPTELAEPIDFGAFRTARQEERRQAEHPDYGNAASEADEAGRIKPKLIRTDFDDLIKYQRYLRQKRETKTAKAAQNGPSRAREFLTRSRTVASPEAEAGEQPPPPPRSTWGAWLRARFSTPKKSVWKLKVKHFSVK